MNKIWYECKVRYRKTDETGIQKVVSEPYLVDAISFTEAESIINERMKENISEEFKVVNIKTAGYAEVHPNNEGETWFKVKVNLVAYNEETGKESKTGLYQLIQAYSVKDAFDNASIAMHNTMGEYVISAITETSIVDVFEYVSKEEQKDGEEWFDDLVDNDADLKAGSGE